MTGTTLWAMSPLPATVVCLRIDGLDQIQIIDEAGTHQIDFPEPAYSLDLGTNPTPTPTHYASRLYVHGHSPYRLRLQLAAGQAHLIEGTGNPRRL